MTQVKIKSEKPGMEDKNAPTYSASFRNLALETWESGGHFAWIVTNAATGQEVARGESTDQMSAMVAAAQAAGSDWGTVKWRGNTEEDESDA